MKNNNKIQNDTRYSISVDFPFEKEYHYSIIKREVEKNGYYIVKELNENYEVKIYTAVLAFILTSDKLQVTNLDTQKKVKINGWEYFKTYFEAYRKGEEYFETEYKVLPNVLYGANADKYVNDICLNYFEIEHDGIHKGWKFVKECYPITIQREIIKNFGYYSGIVSKVEELIKKYPQLFNKFKLCENEFLHSENGTKKEQPKLKIDQIALKYVYEGLQITRENGNEIAKKYGHKSGEKLFQRFTYFRSYANRTGEPTLCTPKKLVNKIKLIESVIELLPTDKQQRAKDEVLILKNIYKKEYC